ncbi:Troponin T [Echinococcus granulosus]|uniref:Troponin T n=1 Tax=Echinococcus granulosus TaxID=6210 RepID=W6V918_ECHGR|nr:Troponin T [Echinococcus granulosus]EUB63044.1 Troponin T [Echinococcus granulosus]
MLAKNKCTRIADPRTCPVTYKSLGGYSRRLSTPTCKFKGARVCIQARAGGGGGKVREHKWTNNVARIGCTIAISLRGSGSASLPLDESISEVRLKMEEDARKRKERAEEEWREYEEIRRAEREKEEEEIRQLRERRERRKKERAEEEARMAEARAIEEQKRRAEEEERTRKKREEEQRKREERERKRAEFAEKSKLTTRRNFVINKKPGSVEQVEEVKHEEVQKSKEQLEAERKAILEQRIQPLQIDGLNGEQLRAKAKELNDIILRLEGDKYDLEQRFSRQSYDASFQLDKRGTKVQNTPDPLAAKISGLPPKISMYSEYERVKDHRSFSERQGVFSGPLFVERYERIEPKVHVVMTEDGFQVGDAPHHPQPPAETEAPAEPTEPVAVTAE